MNDLTQKAWNDHRAALHGFINKRVADGAAVDDLLQEVFVKIHGGSGSLESSETLNAWIYRIARNVIADHYRSQRPVQVLPESLASKELPEEETVQQALSKCVIPFMERLPEPYREAVRLSEIEGISQTELAKRLGISVSGAKSRVQRGREKMKEMLLECCRFEFDSHGTVIDYESHSS